MENFTDQYLDLLLLCRLKIIFAKEQHSGKEVKRLLGVKKEIIERLDIINKPQKTLI